MEKTNIAAHSLEDIKLFMICILSLRADEEQMRTYLCALSDWSGISNPEDFITDSQLTPTVMFIDKSMEMLLVKRRDQWIEYFKSELIRLEEYEKITALKL